MVQEKLTLAAIVALALCAARPIAAQDSGAVFVMTNNSQANEIVVFQRNVGGLLSEAGRFLTGGRGSGGEIDPLRSQDSLILSSDGRWLFAVNAGSNQISQFSVDGTNLELIAVVRSRGVRPISLTQHDDLLYVLNASRRPSIHGFRLGEDGRIVRLKRSRRFLASDVAPGGRAEGPVQVSFSPDGEWLALTDRLTDEIHLFQVAEGGRTVRNSTRWRSAGGGPFGFDFDPRGYLLVSELWGRNPSQTQLAGAVSSYAILEDGTLEILSPSVENFQLATCWLVSDGRGNAFATNTGSGTLSRYRVLRQGKVRRRGGPAFRYRGPPQAFPTDLATTPDGRFLYTLNPGRGTVGMFRVRPQGKLIFLGEAGSLGANSGLQGITAK